MESFKNLVPQYALVIRDGEKQNVKAASTGREQIDKRNVTECDCFDDVAKARVDSKGKHGKQRWTNTLIVICTVCSTR